MKIFNILLNICIVVILVDQVSLVCQESDIEKAIFDKKCYPEVWNMELDPNLRCRNGISTFNSVFNWDIDISQSNTQATSCGGSDKHVVAQIHPSFLGCGGSNLTGNSFITTIDSQNKMNESCLKEVKDFLWDSKTKCTIKNRVVKIDAS